MISAPNIRQDRPTSRQWWIEYRLEIVIVIVGAFAMNLIFIARAFRETGIVDRAAAGQFGDFVGGYVGTLFALIGVVLLFGTLRNQRSAAQHQNFENKYFELLKLHRENVAELQLQQASGRRLFVLLIRELRSILDIVRRLRKKHGQALDKRQLIHIAYYCLFFGTGPTRPECSSRRWWNSILRLWMDSITNSTTQR